MQNFAPSNAGPSNPFELEFEESNFDDEDTFNEFSKFEHRNDPYSKMDDDLSRIFARKINSEKSYYSLGATGNVESTLDTKPTFSQNTTKLVRSSTSNFADLHKSRLLSRVL